MCVALHGMLVPSTDKDLASGLSGPRPIEGTRNYLGTLESEAQRG